MELPNGSGPAVQLPASPWPTTAKEDAAAFRGSGKTPKGSSVFDFRMTKGAKAWAKNYRTEIAASTSSVLGAFSAFPLDFAKSRMQSYNAAFPLDFAKSRMQSYNGAFRWVSRCRRYNHTSYSHTIIHFWTSAGLCRVAHGRHATISPRPRPPPDLAELRMGAIQSNTVLPG